MSNQIIVTFCILSEFLYWIMSRTMQPGWHRRQKLKCVALNLVPQTWKCITKIWKRPGEKSQPCLTYSLVCDYLRQAFFWPFSKNSRLKKLKAVFQPKIQRFWDFWGSSQKTQKKKLYIRRYLFGLMPLMSFLWTCLWVFAIYTHFCVHVWLEKKHKVDC